VCMNRGYVGQISLIRIMEARIWPRVATHCAAREKCKVKNVPPESLCDISPVFRTPFLSPLNNLLTLIFSGENMNSKFSQEF
jgi:hypothetical protein